MLNKKEFGRKQTKQNVPGGSKRSDFKDLKEWKVVSHSVSTLFNGNLSSRTMLA